MGGGRIGGWGKGGLFYYGNDAKSSLRKNDGNSRCEGFSTLILQPSLMFAFPQTRIFHENCFLYCLENSSFDFFYYRIKISHQQW